MQTMYDSGQEVLDELRGNLSSLSTATEASELTMDMKRSMESLKGKRQQGRSSGLQHLTVSNPKRGAVDHRNESL